jgi:hypothetical protein
VWATIEVDPPFLTFIFNVYSIKNFFFLFFYFLFFIFFNFLINYPFPGLLSRLAFFSDNDRFLASEEGKYGFTLCPGPKNDCKYGI